MFDWKIDNIALGLKIYQAHYSLPHEAIELFQVYIEKGDLMIQEICECWYFPD